MDDDFDQHRFIAPESLGGERIDRAVSLVSGCSRSQARLAIEEGNVFVNDIAATEVSKKIHARDEIQINLVEYHAVMPKADDKVSFEVIYEDTDLAVIDKPAGLVVHPGSGNPDGTLVNGLLVHYPEIQGVGSDELRPGIVHRLDKDTSGLMLVARTQAAYNTLVAALKLREVTREYECICWGEMKNANGIIDAPLGRSKKHKIKMSVKEDGKSARTHYEALEKIDGTTYVKCRLESGRTHQIRIHFSAIGHPILGDLLYGGKMPEGYKLSRLALYAKRLVFNHPISGEEMEFSIDIPQELAGLKSHLKKVK